MQEQNSASKKVLFRPLVGAKDPNDLTRLKKTALFKSLSRNKGKSHACLPLSLVSRERVFFFPEIPPWAILKAYLPIFSVWSMPLSLPLN